MAQHLGLLERKARGAALGLDGRFVDARLAGVLTVEQHHLLAVLAAPVDPHQGAAFSDEAAPAQLVDRHAPRFDGDHEALRVPGAVDDSPVDREPYARAWLQAVPVDAAVGRLEDRRRHRGGQPRPGPVELQGRGGEGEHVAVHRGIGHRAERRADLDLAAGGPAQDAAVMNADGAPSQDRRIHDDDVARVADAVEVPLGELEAAGGHGADDARPCSLATSASSRRH